MHKINIQRHAGFYPFNPLLGQVIQSDSPLQNPDQGFIAHLNWTAAQALAAVTNGVLAAFATSALTTIKSTGFAALPCAKNITLTAGGVDADVKAVQGIVRGHDIAGNVISETMPAFTVNVLGSVVGSKAFADITEVEIPGMDGAGVTIAVGFGEKLGIPYKLGLNTLLKGYKGGVLEANAATIAFSSTALESNTIDFDTALDGSIMDAFFIA